MAAYTLAYANCNIDDDVRFRAWVDFISDNLTTMGWAKTADTGQIDTTTVAKPTAGSTAMGYEIRLSNDAFDNVYIKLEYGSGFNAYSKGLWVTLGTGSDGAGAITGEFFARYHFTSITGNGGGTKPGDDFLSGDAGNIRLFCTDDANALYSLGLSITRSHNHAGTDDDETLWVMFWGYSTTTRRWCLGPKGGISTTLGLAGISSIRFSDAVGSGGSNPVYPVQEVNPGVGYVTSKHFKTGWDSLFTHQASYTIDSVVYRAVAGNTTSANMWSTTAPAAMCLLMRYE